MGSNHGRFSRLGGGGHFRPTIHPGVLLRNVPYTVQYSSVYGCWFQPGEVPTVPTAPYVLHSNKLLLHVHPPCRMGRVSNPGYFVFLLVSSLTSLGAMFLITKGAVPSLVALPQIEQGKAIIDACKAGGVDFVVFSSVMACDTAPAAVKHFR